MVILFWIFVGMLELVEQTEWLEDLILQFRRCSNILEAYFVNSLMDKFHVSADFGSCLLGRLLRISLALKSTL